MDSTPEQLESAANFWGKYMQYAEKIRPELAAIEDPMRRFDEINKWLKDQPWDLMLKFIMDENPDNIVDVSCEYRKNTARAYQRLKEVKSLPTEDTVWTMLEVSCLPDEDGQTLRHMAVKDVTGNYVAFNNVNIVEKSLIRQCEELICVATLFPMKGTPRKPAFVTFKDPAMAWEAKDLNVEKFGIKLMATGMEKDGTKPSSAHTRECYVCKLRGSRDLFKKCSSCHAVLYCSKACQRKDWLRKDGNSDEEQYCHKRWCGKMKLYMTKGEMLKKFPFSFAEVTTSEEFDSQSYRKFLEKYGVYNKGLWRRECQLCEENVRYGDIGGLENDTEDPVDLPAFLDEIPSSPPTTVNDWESYYKHRRFRFDSPIAILLQYPLTIFHIVKYCLPNDCPDWWDGVDGSELHIDIIGVEKEVDMLPIFVELGHMLPDLTVDIVMFGNEISPACHGRRFQSHNVRILVQQMLYHRKPDTTRKTHLAIGFNASLSAYKIWAATLVKLKMEKIPAYFTDFSEFYCDSAKTTVESLQIGTISPICVNPFRSPVRTVAENNDMPWYSNGFYFHLVYPG